MIYRIWVHESKAIQTKQKTTTLSHSLTLQMDHSVSRLEHVFLEYRVRETEDSFDVKQVVIKQRSKR